MSDPTTETIPSVMQMDEWEPGRFELRTQLLTTYKDEWSNSSGSVSQIARMLLHQKTERIKALEAELAMMHSKADHGCCNAFCADCDSA